MKRYLLIFLFFALAAGPAAGGRAAGPSHCIEDWSVAARIVAQEKLATIEDVSRLMRAKDLGNLVRTTLCRSGESFVYRLVVRETGGTLSGLTVDARRPFER